MFNGMLCSRCGGIDINCYLCNKWRDYINTYENNRLWGEGNWIRCSICPRDDIGYQVYHHKNHHVS